MNDFQKIPPAERMVMLAKIYHNMWYDEVRFRFIAEIIKDWELHPIKEAKFLNEINNGTEITEAELRTGNLFD
jgi:hypothetical protein